MFKIRKVSQLFTSAQLAILITVYIIALTAFTITVYLKLQNLIVDNLYQATVMANEISNLLGSFFNLMVFVLLSITVLVPLLAMIIISHFKSQLIPLNKQIDAILDGDFEYKRNMRSRDPFKGLMQKLHKLSDQLQKVK